MDGDDFYKSKNSDKSTKYPGMVSTLDAKDLMTVYTQLGKWMDRYNKLTGLTGNVTIMATKKVVEKTNQKNLFGQL